MGHTRLKHPRLEPGSTQCRITDSLRNDRSIALVGDGVTAPTNPSASSDTSSSKPVLFGVGLALLWAVIATARPETTFHLAPLLVAASPAGLAAGTVDRRGAGFLGALGLALGLAVFGYLVAAPGLDGPTLGPFTSVIQETILLTLAGAAIGAAVAFSRLDTEPGRVTPSRRRRQGRRRR